MAAAAMALPMAQLQHLSQLQPPCHLCQALFTDQLSPELCQLSLRLVRVSAEQMLRHHQAQNGVPQEFQPFVAGGALPAVLIGIGTVGQRIFQQRLVPERVS